MLSLAAQVSLPGVCFIELCTTQHADPHRAVPLLCSYIASSGSEYWFLVFTALSLSVFDMYDLPEDCPGDDQYTFAE